MLCPLRTLCHLRCPVTDLAEVEALRGRRLCLTTTEDLGEVPGLLELLVGLHGLRVVGCAAGPTQEIKKAHCFAASIAVEG
jgi:hypothetical protein